MVSVQRKSSAECVIDHFNVENAKRVAFVLVLGFIVFHGVLHLRYGRDSCTWLLTSGRYKGDHEWQPYGCMLHKYSKTDARRCLRYLAFWGKYNSFAFIGDSQLQELYEYFIGVLQTRQDAERAPAAVNGTYRDAKLSLVARLVRAAVGRPMADHFREWQASPQPPSLIVAGGGRALLGANLTAAALARHRRDLALLVQPADELAARGTRVLWRMMEAADAGGVPGKERDVEVYNRAAVEILTHSAAKFWTAPQRVLPPAPAAPAAPVDPAAPAAPAEPEPAPRHSAQVLLNVYCNDHMNYNDGSCCAQPERLSALQAITFAALLLCAAAAAARGVYRWVGSLAPLLGGYGPPAAQPAPPAAPPAAPSSALAALGRLGVVMMYFYLCDRTNFFMKENKYYSEWSFWLPVGYVFALGLFFTEDSRCNRVLHREQTYEWKGWMQAVVLIYQVTGASKVLPIYMLVRTVLSSYLFLTGFGHFHYTWNTGDTSLVRYFRVIFRLNFLTAVLCLTMNRPYQFYSYVPLATFWYTLMFALFALPPHLSAAAAHTPDSRPYQHLYVALKVTGLLAIVVVLYMSEVFFQKIFVSRPWKALFVNSDDDVHQWWLRWKQDRYSLAYGIIFSMAYLLAGTHGARWERARTVLARAAAAAALAALAAYAAFAVLCRQAADCNEVHSYIACVPIVAYITLRNVSAALRGRHSGLFAWLGTFTLELYASQSHIWLAADTHGVLVLLPGAPVLNLLLTTYIFVATCHELHTITEAVLPVAVPQDWRKVLRNLVVFLAALVAIGVHDGML